MITPSVFFTTQHIASIPYIWLIASTPRGLNEDAAVISFSFITKDWVTRYIRSPRSWKLSKLNSFIVQSPIIRATAIPIPRPIRLSVPATFCLLKFLTNCFISWYYGKVDKYCPTAESRDRKSTRLNSSHVRISYAVFCLKKKKKNKKKI